MRKCCLNCQGFAFWDGDYCCVPNMSIHQFGNGDIYMNEDIDNTMQTDETCEEYEYSNKHPEYEEEYKKFKEWQKLCKQLEDHISDNSGFYNKLTKPKYFK